jgi:hypothetical protein
MELLGTQKRLEDVTEEPHERDEFDGYTLVSERMCDWSDYDKALSSDYGPPSPSSRVAPTQFILNNDSDVWSLGPGPRLPKRRRSMEQAILTPSTRLGGKFGSLSRRWRNRSAAGPQLSLITHYSTPVSRSGSIASSHIRSPAPSANSRRGSELPLSPPLPIMSPLQCEVGPMDISPSLNSESYEAGQATTPLLPPLLSELETEDEPVQSPLQSPAIAPAAVLGNSTTSLDVIQPFLPSPPLSTKPSMVSIHNRSRNHTLTGPPLAEIPAMHLREEVPDPWDARLGHANFVIHPEPYTPSSLDLSSYKEYRRNWNQARTNYTKHLARTAEHYGSTSKVYKLTEEKWSSVDKMWHRQHDSMKSALAPMIARASDSDADMAAPTDSNMLLEKPVTKITVPVIDKSGKFPELGDGEIVGPMSVAPPRVLATDGEQSPTTRSPPLSPHKRTLLKFLSDIFHN